jgi:hypothetical protein
MNTPQWKTTLTGFGAAAVLVLTFLASQPYSNGEIALIIPNEWKPYFVTAGIISAGILAAIRGIVSADASSQRALQEQVASLQGMLKDVIKEIDKK